MADNLAAIAAHIRALRGIERWGVGDLKAAFAGYKALPGADPARPRRDGSSANGVGTPWHEVLGVAPNADADAIRKAYRRRAMETHPDQGGTNRAFQAMQQALNRGLEAAGV